MVIFEIIVDPHWFDFHLFFPCQSHHCRHEVHVLHEIFFDSLLVEANAAVYGTGLRKHNTSNTIVKGSIFTGQFSTKSEGLFFRKLSREH